MYVTYKCCVGQISTYFPSHGHCIGVSSWLRSKNMDVSLKLWAPINFACTINPYRQSLLVTKYSLMQFIVSHNPCSTFFSCLESKILHIFCHYTLKHCIFLVFFSCYDYLHVQETVFSIYTMIYFKLHQDSHIAVH